MPGTRTLANHLGLARPCILEGNLHHKSYYILKHSLVPTDKWNLSPRKPPFTANGEHYRKSHLDPMRDQWAVATSAPVGTSIT